MNAILSKFEYIPDVIDKADELIALAKHSKKKEKKVLLEEAEMLRNYYEEHCREGGNNCKQFKTLL